MFVIKFCKHNFILLCSSRCQCISFLFIWGNIYETRWNLFSCQTRTKIKTKTSHYQSVLPTLALTQSQKGKSMLRLKNVNLENRKIFLPLRFYVKSNLGEFKWSKNVNFCNSTGSEFWFLVNLSNFQAPNLPKIQSSESLKMHKMPFYDRLKLPIFDFT